MFVREKRIREAHQRLHLPLPCRDRARGWPRHTAHYQEPGPQGGPRGVRCPRSPGQLPATPSGPWSSRNSRPAIPRGSPASASAPPCCSDACGRRPVAVRSSRISSPGGTSSSRSSGPPSPPSCTGSWSPARIGPARSGWPTMTSPAWTAWRSITSTAAWLGWARNGPRTSKAVPYPWPRARSRTSSRSACSRRRDLFSELSVVFLDTTSLSFTGAGGESLGERGYSKDHRPDLMQMIVGVVIDAAGRPVCSEMWPGNTADVSVLVPVIDRLRSRFAIGRVCVVADRGMISAPTIAALEERGLEYVLGARERTDSLVRTVVLADQRPFTPLCIPRAGGAETQLFVKEVQVEGRRYIVCRNEAEAEKDAADRAAIIAALDQQLKRGDKALIGNSAYRRYLRATAKKAFAIDIGKVADEARYDGVFVLRTNARITPLQAVLRYRDLIQVEQLFRTAKALMRTWPIYYSSDAAIRGHVFCSFLALILRKELDERCCKVGLRPEWGDVLRDLDRLQHATIESAGKTWTVRTQADGCAAALLQATGIALPPRIQATPPPQTGTEPPAPPKRRGRPRRSATRT